jgi:cobalamin biosynthesis protein CbiG
VGGLAKLQAIAGVAHSSAVSAGGGNLIIKKMPNVVKI